jgi:hypothetical protein
MKWNKCLKVLQCSIRKSSCCGINCVQKLCDQDVSRCHILQSRYCLVGHIRDPWSLILLWMFQVPHCFSKIFPTGAKVGIDFHLRFYTMLLTTAIIPMTPMSMITTVFITTTTTVMRMLKMMMTMTMTMTRKTVMMR